MRAIILSTLALAALATHLQAQGTIQFSNLPSAAVTNSLTGARVVPGTTFSAALYAAPDGVADDNHFLPIAGPIGFFAAGFFNGGAVPVLIVPGGGYAMFQVRVWETAYGPSYEVALLHPGMNGRTGLLGKSNLVRCRATDPASVPPEPVRRLVDCGLQGFVLESRPAPSLSINDVVVAEGTNGSPQAVFTVTLQTPSAEMVSVDYATQDGTALAGSDYVAARGTLVFAPGETTQTLAITLTPDAAPEPDEEFVIGLSNAVNAPISKESGTCLITEVRIAGISVDVAVSFNTVAHHRYVVEKSADLVNWRPVAGAEDVAGTGAVVTVYDRGAGCQPHQVYRGRLLE